MGAPLWEGYDKWRPPWEALADVKLDSYQFCPWYPRHLPVVIYSRRVRDLGRKRYWIRCFTCEFRNGPYLDKGHALMEMQILERR